MKTKVWFQTDLGYYATRKKLQSSNMIVGDMQGSKGRLHFHLKDAKDVTFQITTKQKLGIYFPEEVGYEGFLEKVKPFLVKADGTPVEKIKVISKPNGVVKIKDADRKMILRIMKVIKKEKDDNVLLRRINELRLLSWNERVAHYPEVRFGIKEHLEDSKVIRNPEIFKELVYTLSIVVYFEQINKSPDSGELVKELIEDNFGTIASVIESKPEILSYPTLSFLGRSGKKEAVEIIFKWIKNNPEKALREHENLGSALGKRNLYKKYQELIDEKIDDLLRSREKKLLEIGKKLDEIIRLRMC